MTNDIIARAARNNALWCDAVCATHAGAGEFHESLWIHRIGAPRYYPDVVTLRGAEAVAEQTEAIAALVVANPDRDFAVKDSFRTLDLGDPGFTPLFDAQWMRATPRARASGRGLAWARVADEADLTRWEQCWSGETISARSRLFHPSLLARPDIQFVQAVDGGAASGGGILNRGGGVVGLTNVFAGRAEPRAVWDMLVECARSSFPGLPIVAYEQRIETLSAACHAGFAPLGALRIWRKTPVQADRRPGRAGIAGDTGNT